MNFNYRAYLYVNLMAVFYLKSCQSFSLQEGSSQIKFDKLQNRRSVLFEAVTSVAAATFCARTITSPPSTIHGIRPSSLQSCLDLHLPPKPANTIRLYLCRHGQTESNRLHKLQGGNVNPPLNDNGILMAEEMGMALHNSMVEKDREDVLFYHSSLLRAEQTAKIAVSKFSFGNRNVHKTSSPSPRTISLDSLVELDYSSSSWRNRDDYTMPSRKEVHHMYDRWMEGHIDERLGKESARDILNRCASALNTMVEGAKQQEARSVVAVARGNYLRFLLASALDLPLAHYVAGVPLDNGSVSVLDIELGAEPIERTVSNSNMFVKNKSTRWRRPDDFSILLPKSTAVRVNECRHLTGIKQS